MKTTFTTLLTLLIATGLFAQGDIISAADFMKLVKSDKNLIIIDAGKADTYQKMHVKNAVNIPAASLAIEGNDIDGILKSPAALATLFGDAGVSETNTIVVYDEGSQKYSSRVYWTLKYLGAPNVKILHKDMDEWKTVRVPITRMPTPSGKATFTPNVNKNLYADIAQVKSGKAKIVDVRTAEEFSGNADNSDGHLPGAISLDYKLLLTDKEAFKSKDEMAKVLAAYNFTPETPIICYCRTSVRAAVLYVALVNVMGYQHVKVYENSYLE